MKDFMNSFIHVVQLQCTHIQETRSIRKKFKIDIHVQLPCSEIEKILYVESGIFHGEKVV